MGELPWGKTGIIHGRNGTFLEVCIFSKELILWSISFLNVLLQSNQVKLTPQEDINAYTSRFKNAIMNRLFEY